MEEVSQEMRGTGKESRRAVPSYTRAGLHLLKVPVFDPQGRALGGRQSPGLVIDIIPTVSLFLTNK